MISEPLRVQKLAARDIFYTIAAVMLVGIYQALWYVTPGFLEVPLWSGSYLTASFILGALSLLIPIAAVWLIVWKDPKKPTKTYETSGH